MSKAIKAVFFGTHPRQFNGYSKVVYELAKEFQSISDIQFVIFGFQNFYVNTDHRKDLPADITIFDAFASENPRKNGFGIEHVQSFIQKEDPDVCIVYNDMVVIYQVVSELQKIPNRRFKIIAYVDQVYLNQKKEFIQFINQNTDSAILFTPYWEDIIRQQGLTVPTSYLQHGINRLIYFPVPKHLARMYYGLRKEDFIILNLNRNQPRKRWDTCLKAFAEVVSRYPNQPIKLLVGTAMQGGWNLLEIFERELGKRGLTLDMGMKHIIVYDNPQKVTDEATNILYNVADIGINTCDGEGFGLCNFEQAAIGIPQIVPKLGGFLDFFDDTCALMVEPTLAYYVDNSRDMVGGEALMCNYMDYADAIEKYYLNRELRVKHGEVSRRRILEKYPWTSIASKLAGIIRQASPKPPAPPEPVLPERIDITQLDFKNRTQQIMTGEVQLKPPAAAAAALALAPVPEEPAPAPAPAPAAPPQPKASKASKKKKRKGSLDVKTLKALKKKLDRLFDDEDDEEEGEA